MNKKLIYLLTVSLAFGSSEMKLASNPTTPIEILVSLSKDSNEDVRMAVAGNPNTPSEVLAELCKDKEEDVVVKAIENKHTPMSVILLLVNHQEDDIRSAVARKPNLPKEIEEILVKDNDDGVRESLASNINTGDNILTLLSNDKDNDVIEEVAKNPKTPSSVIEKLLENEDYHILIAGNTNVNPTILDKLSDSKYSIGIRMTVAKKSNTSVATIAKLLNTSSPNDALFIKAALARNPNASEKILTDLSTSNNAYFFRPATLIGIALNENTPPSVLDKLGTDENYLVRAMVYKNSKTPVGRLVALEKDKDFDKFGSIDPNQERSLKELSGGNTSSFASASLFFMLNSDYKRSLEVINVFISQRGE
jgi:hypothetical protein